MRNLIILMLLAVVAIGCQRYKYDERADRCRDTETGQFVSMDLCDR